MLTVDTYFMCACYAYRTHQLVYPFDRAVLPSFCDILSMRSTSVFEVPFLSRSSYRFAFILFPILTMQLLSLIHLVPILARTALASQQSPLITDEQEQNQRHNTAKISSSRTWEQSVAYGARILDAVNAKTNDAATAAWGTPIASNFTTVDNLDKYGWVHNPKWTIPLISRAHASTAAAFRTLEVSELHHVLVHHDNAASVTVEGKTYQSVCKTRIFQPPPPPGRPSSPNSCSADTWQNKIRHQRASRSPHSRRQPHPRQSRPRKFPSTNHTASILV